MDNTTTNDRVGGNGAVGLKRRGTNLDAEKVKGNTTTNQLRGGGGDGRRWKLNGRQ